MLSFVMRQMKGQRVKKRLRITDHYTPSLLEFKALSRTVETGQVLLPWELRGELRDLMKNTTRLISFRFMKRAELKRLGRKGPLIVSEPSKEMKHVMTRIKKHLALPAEERKKIK